MNSSHSRTTYLQKHYLSDIKIIKRFHEREGVRSLPIYIVPSMHNQSLPLGVLIPRDTVDSMVSIASLHLVCIDSSLLPFTTVLLFFFLFSSVTSLLDSPFYVYVFVEEISTFLSEISVFFDAISTFFNEITAFFDATVSPFSMLLPVPSFSVS